jgi:hypothetical protein
VQTEAVVSVFLESEVVRQVSDRLCPWYCLAVAIVVTAIPNQCHLCFPKAPVAVTVLHVPESSA